MQELLTGFGIIILYFLICASSALLLKYFAHVPPEPFRKLLHLILLGSLLVWLLVFSTWWVSALVELYTPNGMDTISCPVAAMVVLLPLTALFGGIV